MAEIGVVGQELLELAQTVSPQYQELIRGEMTGRDLLCLTPKIPGLLRHPDWVKQRIVSSAAYTAERREQLLQTLVARQELIRQRRHAGEVVLRAVISTDALDQCGEFAASQAGILREAMYEEGWEIYFVQPTTIRKVCGRLARAYPTLIAGMPERPTSATYIERAYKDPREPHEGWHTDYQTYAHYAGVAADLTDHALSPSAAEKFLAQHAG